MLQLTIDGGEAAVKLRERPLGLSRRGYPTIAQRQVLVLRQLAWWAYAAAACAGQAVAQVLAGYVGMVR